MFKRKACKQCHENGEWSKYSSSELCRLKRTGLIETLRIDEALRSSSAAILRHKDSFSLSELHRKEQACRLVELRELEETSLINATRVMLVAPDRRRRLDPIETSSVRVPSRTLSVYTRESNQTGSSKSCSICLNGVWTWSESVCRQAYATNLEFCQRDEIEIASTRLKPTETRVLFLLEDGSEAPLSQNLFEPGSVKVVYRLSETTIVCRACLPDGKWSKYAQSSTCDSREAFEMSKTRTSSVSEMTTAKLPCPVRDLDKGW